MAKRNLQENGEPVRLSIAQVAAKAVTIFADADKAEAGVAAVGKVWREYATNFVAAHIPQVLSDKEAAAQFRHSFYTQYCDARGTWTPTAPAKSCGEDFQHYNNLKNSAKDSHPTSNSIKAAINNAKVYFKRVMDYAKEATQSGEEGSGARSGPRPITELFRDTLQKVITQGGKVVDKTPLGVEAAKLMLTIIQSAKALDANGFNK